MARLSCFRLFASLLTPAFFALALGALPLAARAANEGQADLDKATEQKLGAQTSSDYSDVIELCESALKKGLDKSNTAFANDLMAAAYSQRGAIKAGKAYHAVLAAGGDVVNDVNWRAYRTEALADLEKGVKLGPKQPGAFFEIAKLNMLPDGDQKRALEALTQTIKLADDDAALRADALLTRSTLHKDAAERLADLNEAAKALPGNAVVLRRRALLEAESGKWKEAVADFDKAIAAEPKQLATYQMEAELLIKLKKLPEALAVLEKGHAAIPNNIELLFAKGQILIAQSKYKEAAVELTKALAIDGANLQILELRAALYEQLGEKANALADIDKILQVKPGQAKYMHMRAALLADSGKYDLALKELQSLRRLDPEDSLTLLQMGMLYSTMKKYDKAVDIYTRMLADRPDDVEAIRGRGDALLNIGKRSGAVADYERALKLEPHDVGILNNFAWVLATAPEDNLRDGRRAIVLATDACKQTKYQEDYILSTLAAAYAETGDFESARKYSAQSLDAKSSDHAEPTRKDELKKELESYKANKPWRESLPLPEDAKKAGETKAAAGGKSGDAATANDPQKSSAAKKQKKKKKAVPKPDDTDTPTPEK
jgi:tetratricopeptide (TPR) repeat protein